MTSVLQLLALPVTSTGFTALPDTISEPSHRAGANNRGNQPIKIQVHGTSNRNKAPRPNNLQQCIKRVLDRNNSDGLPATYEAIYNDCLNVVCVLNTGEGLYASLKLELEQAVSRLSKELLSEKKDHGPWLKKFVGACKWFETQVVRAFSTCSTWYSLLSRRCWSLS